MPEDDPLHQPNDKLYKQSAMTLAQKLHHQGEQKGRQEGRLAALRENVLVALEIRFGAVPQGLREEIQIISDEAKLHALHRTAIQCPGLEVFVEEL